MRSATASARPWPSSALSAVSTLRTPEILAASAATAAVLVPATRMSTSPPMACAAVTTLLVLSFRVALSWSAMTRTAMSEDPRGLEVGDEIGGGFHLDAGLALGRLGDLDHLQPRRGVGAQRGELLHVQRL